MAHACPVLHAGYVARTVSACATAFLAVLGPHAFRRPPPNVRAFQAGSISREEREEVKNVARQLLNRLKAVLVLDWRKRQRARAKVEDAIKVVLDEGLPRAYSPELYNQKCSVLFEHVFERFTGDDERSAPASA